MKCSEPRTAANSLATPGITLDTAGSLQHWSETFLLHRLEKLMISPLDPQKNMALFYMAVMRMENELLCQSGRWYFCFLQLLTEQGGVAVACRCDVSDGHTEEK